MKTLLFTVLFGYFSLLLHAQDSPDSLYVPKSFKKKQELMKHYNFTSQLIENKRFVIEANYLSDNYGNRIVVNSNLNFIRVDSATAVLQVGSNSGIGYNGVGGITAEGRISNWKVNKNEKRKNFSITFTVMTSIGIYDIVMFVGAEGNTTATLSGMSAGRLIYDGDMVAPSKSRVYKGQTF